MEKQYTISEAKNNLPSIVRALDKELAVRLTRRGKPVAILLSIKEYEKLSCKQTGFWNALSAFRQQADGLDISDNDFRGLRDESSGRIVDLS